MDAITLKPMRLWRSAHSPLMVKAWHRKGVWWHAVFTVVGVCALLSGSAALESYGLPLLSVLVIRMPALAAWVRQKGGQRVFEERGTTVDADRIVCTASSGTESVVPRSYVVRAPELNGRHPLCTSADRLLILDKSAFLGTDAEERFRQWLAARTSA